MRGVNPKKSLTQIHRNTHPVIPATRHEYAPTIMKKTPFVPKPLEYADIDIEFKRFVETNLDFPSHDGKKIPTFTLFSGQRFSEYSQTWSHTDENNNVLMNFKTVNREPNPMNGDNQGGLWNIPGDRFYTILTRTVLDDNGTENYEVYSMKQPYAVNLLYRVSFVTDKFESLNTFNQKINDIFKAKQYYIRPNGHWIPMVMDNVSDNSEYSIDGQKFFSQSVTIKVMAYIIGKEDFKIERIPKRRSIHFKGESGRKPTVEIEDIETTELTEHPAVSVTVNFQPWHDKISFDIDCDVTVNDVETENIRSLRIFINDNPITYERGFKMKDGDNVRMFVKLVDIQEKAVVRLTGFDTTVENPVDYELPEIVKDNILKAGQDIVVE